MKTIKLLIVFLLCTSYMINAQKKVTKPINKTKTSQTAKKITTATKPKVIIIPEDYTEIKKLLDEGEISFEDAYNAQFKSINDLTNKVFNKKVEFEHLNFTIRPVDRNFIFNFYDRTFSVINKIENKDLQNQTEIFANVNIHEINNVKSIKKTIGEVEVIFITSHKKCEYIMILNDEKKIQEKEDIPLFILPNEPEMRKRVLTNFKNLVLISYIDPYFTKGENKGPSTKMTDDENEINISFTPKN